MHDSQDAIENPAEALPRRARSARALHLPCGRHALPAPQLVTEAQTHAGAQVSAGTRGIAGRLPVTRGLLKARCADVRLTTESPRSGVPKHRTRLLCGMDDPSRGALFVDRRARGTGPADPARAPRRPESFVVLEVGTLARSRSSVAALLRVSRWAMSRWITSPCPTAWRPGRRTSCLRHERQHDARLDLMGLLHDRSRPRTSPWGKNSSCC